MANMDVIYFQNPESLSIKNEMGSDRNPTILLAGPINLAQVDLLIEWGTSASLPMSRQAFEATSPDI